MNKKISKYYTIAALLMFVTATFQIANEQFLLGVVFFVSAVCFTSAAGAYRKKEKEEKQEGVDSE